MFTRPLGHDFPARRILRHAVASVALLCFVCAGTGCDKKDRVTNPGSSPPTLQHIWPNDDGRSWSFQSTTRAWDMPTPLFYPDAAHVPGVTFDTVAAVLAARPAGTNVVADTSVVQLRFHGTSAIGVSPGLPAGIPVQVLEETETPLLGATSPSESFVRSLIARVRDARPDLRARLAGRVGARPLALAPVAPRFLHGGLWRRTAQWIGTYYATDTDTLLDWKFLDGVLSPGQQFSLQLLPGLAPDVVLCGRVVRSLTAQTPGGAVAGAIEVHYYLDFGMSEGRDESGNLLGFLRSFDCGSVLYAPGIGPIRDDERIGLYTGASLRPPFSGDRLLVLTATSP
jgi:hypothetical protein